MDVVVVVAMKGLTLSKTVFGWHLGVIEHSHEQQNSRFSTRTLQYSCQPITSSISGFNVVAGSFNHSFLP